MNEKRVNKILDVVKQLVDNLDAYKKVNATISDETLTMVEAILKYANDQLERGFIIDSCDEVDKKLKDYELLPN